MRAARRQTLAIVSHASVSRPHGQPGSRTPGKVEQVSTMPWRVKGIESSLAAR
jgi:hypothetical protein